MASGIPRKHARSLLRHIPDLRLPSPRLRKQAFPLPAKPSETALHARFAHREIPTPVLIPRAPEDSSQAEDRAFKRE